MSRPSAAVARRRRRVAAAGAGALLIVAVAVAVWLTAGGTAPPADRAAALVPQQALVYVHASTSDDRDEDARALRALRRFPAWRRLERTVSLSLSQRAGAFDLRRDVGSWLGDEAAVALLDAGGGRADALVLLSVEREATAQGVLQRVARAEPAVEYRGAVIRRFGGVSAAFVAGFLAVGDERVVRAAIDLARSPGAAGALAGVPADARAVEAAAEDRVLSAWASAAALQRLLGAQTGIPFALVAALQRQGMRAVHATLAPTDDGLRANVRQIGAGPGAREFEPELVEAVPRGAIAYLSLPSLEAAGALLPEAARRQLLAPLRQALRADDELSAADVLRPLRGEVAISVTPTLPAPTVTVVARTSDPERTREALSRLRGILAELLFGTENATGQVPVLEEREVGDGITAFGLRLAEGAELLYAISGDRVAVSTSQDGIRRALTEGESLAAGDELEAATGGVPERAEALGFLDPSQLLALADAAGLTAGTAVQTARDDLRVVRALGAVVRRQGTDTTAELHLLLP